MPVSMIDLLARASVHLATTPPDEDEVTPGIIGFVATFLVAAAAVLLILDMVRRIRRVNYRARVRDQLDAEEAIAEAEEAAAAGAPDAADPQRPQRPDES